MAYCPNCEAELAAQARGCGACGAEFAADGWQPVARKGERPPVPKSRRVMSGIAKTIGALLSLVFVGWGALWASEKNSGEWAAAAFAMAIAVVAVAFFARARWMLLMLLATFIFGFASCTANFRWAGG